MEEKTCCFFGHRSISETEKLRENLYLEIEHLIVNNGVDTFLFGTKLGFDSLCLETVTKLKEKHPYIKRINVRAQYPYINDWYEKSLLKIYDETYYPERIVGAGRAVYVERNIEMIKRSRYCVIYYNGAEATQKRKSGTKIALDYATKHGKEIILMNSSKK